MINVYCEYRRFAKRQLKEICVLEQVNQPVIDSRITLNYKVTLKE
jgi:hypothetical protein